MDLGDVHAVGNASSSTWRDLNTDPSQGEGDGGGCRENAIDLAQLFSDNHLRPLNQQKTPSRHRPGVRSFLHFDARCEPYGRRFRSARNNNKARRFRRDTILLLYLARAGRSSAVLAWGEKSERALEGWPHGASAVRHRRRAAGRSQLRRKWLLCNALRANAERSWGRSHAKRRDEMGSKRSHEKGVLC